MTRCCNRSRTRLGLPGSRCATWGIPLRADSQWRGSPAAPRSEREAAIGEDDLRVDPSTLLAYQERHDPGYVLRLAQPLQRIRLLEVVYLGFALALEEELGCHRPWGHGIHGNVAAAHLVGQHVHQSFYTGLRSDVGAVAGKALGQHAAAHGDDAATF